jgi:glutathione peroxidase
MKRLSTLLLLFAVMIFSTAFTADESNKNVHDFKVKDIEGNEVKLSDYEGKVLLIVNVASKCGLTPQYEDLQELYEMYEGKGLEILGFPANNFMGQEPGTNSEIKSFCTNKYKVTFDMFSKISVKGKDIHPLYEYLTKKENNGKIDAPVKWNFQKFLIDRNGEIICSFSPRDKVSDAEVLKTIEKALKNK